MATGTVYSTWSAEKLPKGASQKRKVRTYYTWTSTETATTYKLSITAYIQISGGSATMDGNTVTISGTSQTSVKSASKGFVYGGDTTIKMCSATYTWTKKTSAYSATVKSTYVCASGRLFAGTYTASKAFTIPALAAEKITFNANGGSGTVPATISTYYGVANTIPSNSLTRTGYTFKNWNTASDGSGTAYATGATIKPTANVTLYAQWQTTYVKPNIENLVAFRVAAKNASTPTVTSTGTMGFCRFNLNGGANYTFTSASVKFGDATAITMTKSGSTAYGYSSSGAISQTSMYTVTVTVVVTGADGIGRTYTDTTYISKSVPAMDVSKDGNCVAIFANADDGLTESEFRVYGDASFKEDVSIDSNLTLGGNTLADFVVETGTDNGWTYKKYSDGTFEAWRTVTNTLSYSTAMGNLYRSSEYEMTLPSFTSTLEYAQGDCNATQWVTFTNLTTSPKWCIVSSASATSQSRTIKFFIIGTC